MAIEKAEMTIAGKEFKIVSFRETELVLRYMGPTENPGDSELKIGHEYIIPYKTLRSFERILDVKPNGYELVTRITYRGNEKTEATHRRYLSILTWN